MRVDVTPESLDVEPGRPAGLGVSIYNDESVIVAYRIRVLGLDPSWVSIDEPRLSLFPDTTETAQVLLDIPPEAPAGTRRIGIEVTSLTEPTVTEIVEIEIRTPEEPTGRLELEPPSVYGTKTGTFGVTVSNEGNTPLEIELEAEDEEDHLEFTFQPTITRLAPGERGFVQAVARGSRPWFGNPTAHTFRVTAIENELVSPAVGTLVQRARIGRGGLSLIGLLLAATVFAVVLTASLGRVVDHSRANDDLLLNVVRGETDEETVTDPGSIGGTATLLTSGAPVSGVTVDLFSADDPNQLTASTATEEDGAFEFGGLAEGDYKVRFRGAGFTEMWHAEALTFEDADTVEVTEGETSSDIDARLGGVPGSITGQILGEDPGGAVVTLQVPADAIEGEVDAIVMSAVVDATGEFTLEEVPAPSSYVLRVEKPGFAPAVRLVNIAAGETIEGVELRLRTGDGSITGSVVDGDGPLGGAQIVASSGEVEVRGASLTQDGVGDFTLRDLPTPATYTLEVSADGYQSETFAVRLDTGEQAEGVQVRLRQATGSVSGTVAIAGEGPVGGVRVSVSDGENEYSTRSLSTGDVGSYRLDDLPVPGSYTVTFARDGLATQTRSVQLDASGDNERTGVDANLTRADGVLRGTVTDEDGTSLGGVQVTATSGEDSATTVSAHDPPGAYELRNLPAGTYTVTFERSGSQPQAVLVALAPGEVETLDAVLAPQASLGGTVTVGGSETAGLQVRIFLAETYPSEVVDTTITAGDGSYVFGGLNAPETYIVEFLNAGGTVVGTETVTLLAGEQRDDVDFDIP
ncbi:MAG: carboxypeptidase regulatory-like domain-containing protein [Acidimicrobiales bacterium]